MRVRDTGPGIPEAVRENLFIPFFTTKDRGTGLGLPICQRIVQSHGGTLEVHSRPGQGAEFVVRLPARPAQANEAPSEPEAAAGGATVVPFRRRGYARPPGPGIPSPVRGTTDHMSRVLVVDDEANIRKVLAALLKREGHDAVLASDGAEALSALEAESSDIDVVVTDLKMPRVDGLTVLREVTRRYPEIPVIMITAHGTVDTAVEAMKAGAFDLLQKPFEQEDLRILIGKAVRTRQLAREDVHGEALEGSLALLASNSPSMREVVDVVKRVADTPSTVLITGESGTGKELVASALHESSSRRDKPFIKINCAAIPRELMEAELFGYEKGAFTGAVASKPGRFELADGGSLFLDEIGEIPPEMQVKLLRALQESQFERVGGIKTLHVDVRLIAATNRDLTKEIAEGRFREDLFYRLNVVPIVLPPSGRDPATSRAWWRTSWRSTTSASAGR